MLRIVAEKCTQVLIDHKTIEPDSRNIYIYGFELFWWPTFCILSILMLSVIFGYLRLAATFLFFFIPIRIPAGGYHAKSYGRCFILTNSVAIICVAVSALLWKVEISEYIMWVLLLIAWGYIWINSPVESKGHPLRPERITKNRRYARILLLMELVILLLFRSIHNSCVIYTAIVSSCAVAIMILLAKEGE